MIKISVIITTYNSERSIGNVLSSILSQKGIDEKFELELIVIDDHSTDKTIDIIRGFNRVILIQNDKNSGGPNKGRNIGLELASGDFICINDHDDTWLENKIETTLPFLAEDRIIFSGYYLIDPRTQTNKTVISSNSKKGLLEFDVNETFTNIFLRNWKTQNTYMSTLVFPNSKKHIRFEENFGMIDYDWVLKLFENMKTLQINKPLINRVLDGGNLSLNKIYRRNDFYASLSTIESYADKYPSEFKKAYSRAYSSKAKYHYMMGETKLARHFFKRSEWSIKNLLYYVTTFWGYKQVNKKLKVFGL